MIDKATIEQIKSRADIVEVVGDYVRLTKRGANYMGLCPFHNERTPSFSVSPRRNFCYCFSCHKGGSPVNFIMEKEGVSYHDALLHLANKYGIKVEERELSDEERRQQSERESMLVANDWAMREMEYNLRNTEEGRNVGLSYLYGRGLTDSAIKAFHLGYALDLSGDLAGKAKRAGYDLEVFKTIGLVGEGRNGGWYDRFRGRVVFPIINSAGKVIAFGGRDLKGDNAKYINSPESAVYKKSNELYGLYQAKNEIVRQDRCYLVEGYMDVIGMWQSGVENVIASSGTALTDGQIALIHRFTNNVTLIYDGDAAGIKASLRGVDMLLSHKLDVSVVILPDGHDPDSFSRKHTPEEFRDFISVNQTDVIRFKAAVMLKEAAGDPLRRTAAIHSVVESIACIPDDIKRQVYIQECSSLLNVNEKVIANEVRKERISVIEKWKSERAKRDFPDSQFTSQTASAESIAATASAATNAISAHENTAMSRVKDQRDRMLLPLEREVLRYCVRYGMLDFGQLITPENAEGESDDDATWINVAEYIAEEMRAGEIEFSNELFRRTFEIILGLKEKYSASAAELYSTLQQQSETIRAEERQKIAESNLDMASLQREEEKLESRINDNIMRSLMEFAINFTGRELASHEDDDIRRLTISLLTDRHKLSKRYCKNESNQEPSQLQELVPRAMFEWKEGLIDIEINEIKKRLSDPAVASDYNAVTEIQKQLSDLYGSRKEIAKNIGERIVSPR